MRPSMKNKNSILIAALLALAVGMPGCSDLKTDLPSPVASGVQAHGATWLDTSSSGFHGKVVDAANGDVHECLKCHGLNYRGGTSGISCVKCHQEKGATLHGKGWIDQSSPNFHGNAVRAMGWDMRSCQACHGVLYEGGRVGVSCRDCHQDGAGPENCTTCHGSHGSVSTPAPPRDLSKNSSRSARGVGAHQIHLAGSSIFGTMLCSECHTVPGSVYVAGHIDSTARAEVLFNNSLTKTRTNEIGTIDYDPGLPTYTPSPSYSQAALACSNTYCHGYFKNGNLAFAPTWNDTTGASWACGTCHGDVTKPLNTVARSVPKTTAQGGSHPDVVALGQTNCVVCHGDVVDANFRIINTSKHINGKLNVVGLTPGVFEERDY